MGRGEAGAGEGVQPLEALVTLGEQAVAGPKHAYIEPERRKAHTGIQGVVEGGGTFP
jgi:hypothetical protein